MLFMLIPLSLTIINVKVSEPFCLTVWTPADVLRVGGFMTD